MNVLCTSIATASGVGTRRDWFIVRENGLAGVGPWYSDGPARWLTPGDRPDDRIVDSDDIDAIRAEIAEFGESHMRSFLRDSGLAIAVQSEKFNRCERGEYCVDVQYDSGSLSSGVRTKYRCETLDLSWSSEVS